MSVPAESSPLHSEPVTDANGKCDQEEFPADADAAESKDEFAPLREFKPESPAAAALERGQGHDKDYDTTTAAAEKDPVDDARDDTQKAPADEPPPSVGGADRQSVFLADEVGGL